MLRMVSRSCAGSVGQSAASVASSSGEVAAEPVDPSKWCAFWCAAVFVVSPDSGQALAAKGLAGHIEGA